MKTTTVTASLTRLTKLNFVNAYLVREDDGFTLVDTTLSAADGIITAATEAGAEIKRILLTHGHIDHAGSVDALSAKLGSAVPIMIGELDARLLAGESIDFGATGRKRGGWPKLTSHLEILAAGDQVGSLQAIASPGHTLGHLAFLDVRDGSLIAGDAYLTMGGVVAVPSHPTFPFPLPYTGTADRSLAVSSAESLRGLNPTLLAVGHGKPVTDPGAAMDRAIAAATRARKS